MADSVAGNQRQTESALANNNAKIEQQQEKSAGQLNIFVSSPPSPPAKPQTALLPASYYLPGSANEMFLLESMEAQKRLEKKRTNGEGEEGDGDEEGEEGDEHSEDKEDPAAALDRANRRRTRVYRTLVWLQFSFTVFTCIFILVILILIAVILVLLVDVINRTEHAIRENPVSQMYQKLKHAVNKIPGPG